MGYMDELEEAADDLMAGDEVAELADVVQAVHSGDPGRGGQPATQVTDYSVVPKDGERLAVPAGTTTVDFKDGVVRHEQLGRVGEVKSLDQMSGAFHGRIDAELRSVYVFSDVTATLRFNGAGEGHTIDSCNYYPLKSQGFTSLTIECPLPFTFGLTASTRRDAFDTSAVSQHMDRYGEVSGTLDSWNAVPLQPHHLYEDHGTQYGKAPLHVISYARNHLFIENTTTEDTGAAAADIDIRVLARNNHPGGGKYYQVASWTNVSDGDHVSLDVAEKHHFLKVEVTNSAAGNTVAAQVQAAGGTP